jgi:sporulation protein YlmC with PRC-barrel domain
MYEAAVEKVATQKASNSSARLEIMRVFSNIRDEALARLESQLLQIKLVTSLDDIFDYSLQPSPESTDLDLINVILESDVERTQEESQRHQSDQPVNVLPKRGATSLVINHTDDLEHFLHITINDQGSEINKVVEMPANKTVDVGDMIVIDEPERQNAFTVQDLAFWERRGYKVRLSKMLTCTLPRTTASLAILAENRELEPAVQSFVVGSFDGSKDSSNGPELFVLCACYINGYGCRSNVIEVLSKPQQAVDLVHHPSRAFLHRIWAACQPQEDNPGKKYLEDYAKAGSRPALEELRKVGPKDKLDGIERWITDASGGVGADWLSTPEMLNGHTQSQ